MKKTFTLLVAFLAMQTTYSQYVVNATNHTPSIGDVETMAVDTLPSVSPGGSGENQNWDLSGIVEHVESVTNFVDPATTPFGSEYPNANLAVDFGGFFGYIETTNDFGRMIGVGMDVEMFETQVQGHSAVEPFDTLLVYPCSEGTNYIDESNWTVTAYLGQEIEGFQVDSIRNTESKLEDVSFDGYGTLITPNGTFKNAVREKVVTTTTTLQEGYIAFFGWMSPTGPEVEETVVYNWYSGHHKFLIASVTTDASGNYVYEAMYNKDASSTDNIADVSGENQITFYPNPVVNNAVVVGAKENQNANIFDATGKLVEVVNLNRGITNISLGHLPKGTYQLQMVETTSGVANTVTFVKQ